MKRLIPASIIFVIVIITYILSLNYITKSCESTNKLLDKSVEAYKENHTAEKEAEKIKKYWQKEEKILSFFVNHDHIDQIEQAISTLNVYAKEKDNILFYEYADTIRVLLHQIVEETRITTHSIF
jgi:cAMP phosphodiesterase